MHPYSRKSDAAAERQWPSRDQAYRQPKVRGGLLVLGARRARFTSDMDGKEQTDARWNAYRMELARALFCEVFRKQAGINAAVLQSTTSPLWGRESIRLWGYGELGQVAEAPAGYQKLNALT